MTSHTNREKIHLLNQKQTRLISSITYFLLIQFPSSVIYSIHYLYGCLQPLYFYSYTHAASFLMKNEGCAELLTNETTWHGGRQPSLLSPNLAYCGTRVFPQNLIHLVNPPRNKGSRTATPPPLPPKQGAQKKNSSMQCLYFV